jgi:hypothetical protein
MLELRSGLFHQAVEDLIARAVGKVGQQKWCLYQLLGERGLAAICSFIQFNISPTSGS